MTFYNISFQSPVENLIFDEVLLQQAEKDNAGEALRLWESPVYFIVLGRVGRLDEEVNVDQCRSDGIPVFRRTSGGGTVVQGPGCLNFSFILSKQKRPVLNDLHQSYREILFPVVKLLEEQGVNAVFHPVCDLALVDGQKKFSGNAQRRCRNFILHHGTILYDFNLSLIEKYLTMPKKIPDYRGSRTHRDFVANIDMTKSGLIDAFYQAFQCDQSFDQLSVIQKNYLKSFPRTNLCL